MASHKNKSVIFMKAMALFVLIVIPTTSIAQTGIVFYDFNGARIGELLRPHGPLDKFIEVLTSDNYLMTVDVTNGAVTTEEGFVPSTFYVETELCNNGGKWFLRIEVTTPDWVHSRGGKIIPIAAEGGFVQVEWGRSAPITAQWEIVLDPGFCVVPDGNTTFSAVAVTVFKAEQRGIHLNNNGVWGFKTPFTVKFERPDTISCNGFESCTAVK